MLSSSGFTFVAKLGNILNKKGLVIGKDKTMSSYAAKPGGRA